MHLMKRHILFYPIFISIAFAYISVAAQTVPRSVIANASGTLSSQQIIISAVVGEPVTGTLSNIPENRFLTVGFAQPDEELQNILNNVSPSALIVYPNPAKGSTINLAFNHVPDGTYIVSLVDESARVLQSFTIDYSSSKALYYPIDVSRLSGGVYFISVSNDLIFKGQVKFIKL